MYSAEFLNFVFFLTQYIHIEKENIQLKKNKHVFFLLKYST